MDTPLQAVLSSWPLDVWVLLPLALSAVVYLRGWMCLRRRSARFGAGRLAAFVGGLLAIALALVSPIEPFSFLLLQVHMVQHLLLMMVAPPLLWLGRPALPLLRGLPLALRHWLGPFLREPFLRGCMERLTDLPVAWLLFVVSTWLWHVPALFEAALRQPAWHFLEHACFLGTALLFWYPVVQPGPLALGRSRWLLLPYLLLADLQNTVLSAFLCFSDRVIYRHYESVPRLWGISALDDQASAGALMWVPGSIAYLLPLAWIGFHLLYRQAGEAARRGAAAGPAHSRPAASPRIALPLVQVPAAASAPDVLRWPLLGRFLRWRHARLALQVPLLLVAGLIILDGLVGPDLAPLNLAGVLPWVHWRGLVVLGLLSAGNVFCLACPFLLPRTLARRWLPAARRWPRWLRSKWLAVALLLLFFCSYEVFDLWASPWWTAWIALGYFAAAFVIDGCFRGAAFCKYLCPIGQFHFTGSLLSPWEVKVRDPELCRHCTSKDCIRGNERAPGCELHLFQPRKAGNFDCTFCLDCIHACPHDNVGIRGVVPGKELTRDRHGSGVGRLSRRLDLAVLVAVLVFAAFVNAAGMVAPVVDWQDRLAGWLGWRPLAAVALSYVACLGLVPAGLVAGAAACSRWSSRDREGWPAVARRFVYALWPLGLAMWLAHYSFHLFTGWDGAIPVIQRLASDWGIAVLGTPAWDCACCAPPADWLLKLEIVFLDVGLVGSLYLAWRLALARHDTLRAAFAAFWPWAALALLLFALGLWILFQPMEMRGTMAILQ